MKKALVFSVLLFTSLFGDQSTRREDLKLIIEKNFLGSNGETFINFLAAEAIANSNKSLEPDFLINKFRETLLEDQFFSRLTSSYDLFSKEEIAELRRIHENPVFEKYSLYSGEIFKTNLHVIKEILLDLANVYGEEKFFQEAVELIEITQGNFQQEILESPEPVIIDVYSKYCSPCRLMDPIVEDLSREYVGRIRFVKLNADIEGEIVQQLGVTHLPTLLFVKPEERAIYLKINGFISKKDLQEKIEEFLY